MRAVLEINSITACYVKHTNYYQQYGMVWYGINLFDITEIHNTLL